MAESTCKHGATEPHGEIGKNWCAGPPRSWYFEAGWRRQLEDQMNLNTDMFTRFAEAQEIDASQVPNDINEPFIIRGDQTARMSSHAVSEEPFVVGSFFDRLNDFTPMGWIGWGEVHWYGDTPIYDALVAERGNPRHY